MDREIKFRGKCVPDSRYAGEWVTGGYVAPESDCKKQDEGLIIYYFGGNSTFTCHVIPETVGQFTGLRDKSGREIYEGDIFDLREFRIKVVYEVDMGRFVLRTDVEKSWMLPLDKAFCSHYAIVGNVYDNPELLDNVSRK